MSLFRRTPSPILLSLCLTLSDLLLITMMTALPASLFAHGSDRESLTATAEPTDYVCEKPTCLADRIPTDPTLFERLPDTLQLDEIVIRSTRLPAPPRYQPVAVRKLDSLTHGHLDRKSVSELLSRYSSLFIQDNGPGAMATLSQRGLSPSQTQVLWEGFPINSLSI